MHGMIISWASHSTVVTLSGRFDPVVHQHLLAEALARSQRLRSMRLRVHDDGLDGNGLRGNHGIVTLWRIDCWDMRTRDSLSSRIQAEARSLGSARYYRSSDRPLVSNQRHLHVDLILLHQTECSVSDCL